MYTLNAYYVWRIRKSISKHTIRCRTDATFVQRILSRNEKYRVLQSRASNSVFCVELARYQIYDAPMLSRSTRRDRETTLRLPRRRVARLTLYIIMSPQIVPRLTVGRLRRPPSLAIPNVYAARSGWILLTYAFDRTDPWTYLAVAAQPHDVDDDAAAAAGESIEIRVGLATTWPDGQMVFYVHENKTDSPERTLAVATNNYKHIKSV